MSMKAPLLIALLAGCAVLTACKKKEEVAPAVVAADAQAAAPAATAAAPAAAAPAAPAAEADPEMAEKKAKLDYATMEDAYINDAKGQWAVDAKASSTFGDDGGKKPADSNLPKNATGTPDGRSWSNGKQDIGFDHIELSYAKPVSATEVRLVIPGGEGAEAISKVELQDVDGKWNMIWSGVSDVKRDQRGSRTWFVKTFPATSYKVKAVKYTIANNVERGYKQVDSAQLVGE
jgi:hypothetical protein